MGSCCGTPLKTSLFLWDRHEFTLKMGKELLRSGSWQCEHRGWLGVRETRAARNLDALEDQVLQEVKSGQPPSLRGGGGGSWNS